MNYAKKPKMGRCLLGGLGDDRHVHYARALDQSLATGNHGIRLFGSGDWNDGMNRVGEAGKGERI
jgi:hypothetical protein